MNISEIQNGTNITIILYYLSLYVFYYDSVLDKGPRSNYLASNRLFVDDEKLLWWCSILNRNYIYS